MGREARHEYAAAAVGQHGMDAHAQAEAVEHGHDGQHLVPDVEDGVGGHDLRAQRVEVHVGQQYALGDAGDAKAVEHHRGGVGPLGHPHLAACSLAGGEEVVPQHRALNPGHPGDLAALGERLSPASSAGSAVLHRGDDQVLQTGSVGADIR